MRITKADSTFPTRRGGGRPEGNPGNKGNTTAGESRRGYRGGRQRVYPPFSRWSTSVMLTDREIGIALFLGKDSIIKGISRALELCATHISPDLNLPLDNRDEMKAWTHYPPNGPVMAYAVDKLSRDILAAAPAAEPTAPGQSPSETALHAMTDSWDDVPARHS